MAIINLTYVFNLETMLPNRLVLIVVLLVLHTRTTSPLWRPYYDRYPLIITDRVRYYRLAYAIQTYALSVILITFCVYHTNVPGYQHHLCTPVICHGSGFVLDRMVPGRSLTLYPSNASLSLFHHPGARLQCIFYPYGGILVTCG